jgi:hypothetical protein
MTPLKSTTRPILLISRYHLLEGKTLMRSCYPAQAYPAAQQLFQSLGRIYSGP